MSSELFDRLKPLCVRLTEVECTQALSELDECIKSAETEQLQNLQEYILFPLRLNLRKNYNATDFKSKLIKVMALLFGKTKTTRLESFLDVFQQLSMLLSDPREAGKLRDTSEEYKEATIMCVSNMFENLPDALLIDVYTPGHVAALGHWVSLLLNAAELERSRAIRHAAIAGLQACAQRKRESLDISIEMQIADVFAAFLPGIAMALTRITTGNQKQGHTLTAVALDTWQALVCLVMSEKTDESIVRDQLKQNNQSKVSPSDPSPKIAKKNQSMLSHADKDDRLRQLLVSRSPDWRRTTSDRLALLAERLRALTSHPHWRVRLALVHWAQQLITNCQRWLVPCLRHCVESLVSSLSDDYTEVATAAHTALSACCLHDNGSLTARNRDLGELAGLLAALSTQTEPAGERAKCTTRQTGDQANGAAETAGEATARPAQQSLGDVVQENLYSLLTEMPRRFRSIDEVDKLCSARLLRGYVTLLGSNVTTHLLTSRAHLQRLSQCLLQVLEFDCSALEVISEQTGTGRMLADSDTTTLLSRKRFLHFRDQQILTELQTTCRLLAKQGDVRVLVDHFLELLHQSVVQRKQATLVLGQFMLGLAETQAPPGGVAGSHQSQTINQTQASPGWVAGNHQSQTINLSDTAGSSYTGNLSDQGKDNENSRFEHCNSLSDQPMSNLGSSVDHEQLEQLCSTVLDVFLDPVFLDVPTSTDTLSPDELVGHSGDLKGPGARHAMTSLQIVARATAEQKGSATLRQVHSNIVLVCLLLECVAAVAKAMGEAFRVELIRVLYPVLEKIGSPNSAISETARNAAQHIAAALQYSGVEALLLDNLDYLVSAVCLRMRHLSRHPRAPLVLRVLLRHCHHSNVLPLLQDVITQVFASMDADHASRALSLMHTLQDMALFIERCYSHAEGTGAQPASANKPAAVNTHPLTPADVGRNICEYLRLKRVAEETDILDSNLGEPGGGDMNGELPADCDNEEKPVEEMEENEKPEPFYVTTVKEILDRCVHLLSSPDSHVRLVTMETLIVCLRCLQPHQNALLPQVHQLWPALVPRFTDSDMRVVLKACEVLSVCAAVSGDFIRLRVVKEVIPRLTAFLSKQHTASLQGGPVYTHSLGCKVQAAVLSQVGRLCSLVGAAEQQLLPVLRACVPYLSARQPRSLQQACVKTFKELSSLEPHTVWLMCAELGGVEFPPPPPLPGFKHVKFQQSTCTAEYRDNLTLLMEKVQ